LNPLHLSGYGVKLRVCDLRTRSELEIIDGKQDLRPYKTTQYRPRRFPYDSVVIDSHSGYVSLQALHWLSRNKVPVFIMNYDGSLISSILPPAPIKADLRAAQLKAAENPRMKFKIARALIEAKIARSIQVLEWLAERYDVSREVMLVKREAMDLRRARTVAAIRSVEGRVALKYWSAYGKALPESLDFQGRMTSSHQNNASDPVNAALNYGYGFLEGECRRAINAVGLEPSVGFLHEFSDYQTKQSLVYDLEEPFRWLIDVTAIEAFGSGKLNVSDFYFTGDDYRYRFDIEAKGKFIGLLRQQFNLGVAYKGRVLKWDTIIEQKTNELGRFLTGGSHSLELEEPTPIFESQEVEKELRSRILKLTLTGARELGIGKSTFHYLRNRTRGTKALRIHKMTKVKLGMSRSS